MERRICSAKLDTGYGLGNIRWVSDGKPLLELSFEVSPKVPVVDDPGRDDVGVGGVAASAEELPRVVAPPETRAVALKHKQISNRSDIHHDFILKTNKTADLSENIITCSTFMPQPAHLHLWPPRARARLRGAGCTCIKSVSN